MKKCPVQVIGGTKPSAPVCASFDLGCIKMEFDGTVVIQSTESRDALREMAVGLPDVVYLSMPFKWPRLEKYLQRGFACLPRMFIHPHVPGEDPDASPDFPGYTKAVKCAADTPDFTVLTYTRNPVVKATRAV